jgi:hypothetical protein
MRNRPLAPDEDAAVGVSTLQPIRVGEVLEDQGGARSCLSLWQSRGCAGEPYVACRVLQGDH